MIPPSRSKTNRPASRPSPGKGRRPGTGDAPAPAPDEKRLNAAIMFSASGYSTEGPQLMGINAASEGMLHAMARYAGVDTLYAMTGSEDSARRFDEVVRDKAPDMPTRWVAPTDTDGLARVGTVLLPGPGLASFGWMRRSAGRGAYSLCGITHTTATQIVMDALIGLTTAPVYQWDAVICTSSAVRSMVSTVIDDQLAYLADRFRRTKWPLPQFPVIPLGIECDDFRPVPGNRKRWRTQLGIAAADVAMLFVGRLSFHAKAHPIPLFQAMQAAAETAACRLHLIMAGWFQNEAVEQAYRHEAQAICPAVTLHFLDGRLPEVRRSIRSAADVFVAPMDNVQETFGLAVIEAMAAGLPVIASDWDGFKDTVRDGVDGIRVRTIAVPAGMCADLAMRYAADMDNYDLFIGKASQLVAIDVGDLTRALSSLAADPERRRRMGAAGRARARRHYDWRVIIGRYQALWADLAARRQKAARTGPELPSNTARPDPFHAFSAYPTEAATQHSIVGRTVQPLSLLPVLLASPMVEFARSILPSPQEFEQILALIGQEPTTIEILLQSSEPARHHFLWRGIVWLAKFGFVTIR